jgi:HEPN domain-containing protein
LASQLVQDWLDKAAEDEQAVGLISANKGPWSIAAYHIQQAAEKYVKALLIHHAIAPPKTHSIPSLLALLPNHSVPASVSSAAAAVSSFAWITRYPGVPPSTEADVIQANNDLEQVRSWVLSLL